MTSVNRDKQRNKKAAKRAEIEAHSAANQIIRAAQSCEDIFTLVPVFKDFTRNGLKLTIEDVPAEKIPVPEQTRLFDLTKELMQQHYDDAKFDGRGWNDKAKWRELTSDDARFLIARNQPNENASTEQTIPGEIVGFVHYRFTLEEGETPVCYVYEIHLFSSVRGKGLGKWMMQTLELSSRKLNLHKVMCTCFKSNQRAASFYMEKLKWMIDETSPDNCIDEFAADDPAFNHYILSKTLPQAVPVSH